MIPGTPIQVADPPPFANENEQHSLITWNSTALSTWVLVTGPASLAAHIQLLDEYQRNVEPEATNQDSLVLDGSIETGYKTLADCMPNIGPSSALDFPGLVMPALH